MAKSKKAITVEVPDFRNEREEAEWWDHHRDIVEGTLMNAGPPKGRSISTEVTLKRRSKLVALRLPETDLALARRQAEIQGLGYQTYMKMLLHQALQREQRKRSA